MRSVYREHPVQMVDLMLQQFRTVALKLGFMRLPPQVVVAHADPVRPEHAHQQVGIGEAVIPHGEVLVTNVDDLGIHEHPGLVHLDVNEAERCPDLRGRNATAASMTRLPVVQGVSQVVHHDPNRRGLRVGNQLAALAQDRIAEKANSTDSHAAKVGPAVRTVNYPRAAFRDCLAAKPLLRNGIRRFQRLAAMPTVILVAGVAACSDSTGGSTPTSELTPDFSISASPNTITFVIARLEANQFATVRLPDSDVLGVTAAGQAKQMRWSLGALGAGYYAASLTQLDPGTTITIALSRSDGGNAPNSQVTMPEPVNLTAPVAGEAATAGDTLVVSWSPSGTADQIQIVLRSVQCTRPGAGATQTASVVGDPGTAKVLIDPGLLPPLNPGEQCDVDVQVQRARLGTVDPAYAAGGVIQARQLDVVRIVVLQP